MKHVKTIGSYRIVQELADDRFYYNVVDNVGKELDQFTSLEKAQEFITQIFGG